MLFKGGGELMEIFEIVLSAETTDELARRSNATGDSIEVIIGSIIGAWADEQKETRDPDYGIELFEEEE